MKQISQEWNRYSEVSGKIAAKQQQRISRSRCSAGLMMKENLVHVLPEPGHYAKNWAIHAP